MKMVLNVELVVAIVGLIGVVGGGVWKFHKFSKEQAEKELKVSNRADLSEANHISMLKKTEEIQAHLSNLERELHENVKHIEEKFQDKLEKLEEKSLATYEKAISEVKDMIKSQDSKIDKLIELILNRK